MTFDHPNQHGCLPDAVQGNGQHNPADLKKPIAAETTPLSTGAAPASAAPTSLLDRIAALERRVLALEALVNKTSALANAVNEMVSAWPGPFTAEQIRQAILERYPELKQAEGRHTVNSKLFRMAKQGIIVTTVQGTGPSSSIYERAECPPADAGRPGCKRGKHAKNQSGLTSVLRAALDDLPEQFTQPDFKAWLATKMPNMDVPDGSWSATLCDLVELGELMVAKAANRGTNFKVYQRTSKRVAASGDEVRGMEAAWADFRRQITPELKPAQSWDSSHEVPLGRRRTRS